MVEWIESLMSSLGYVGIVVLMFLENVFPPIPSELIMPLAGFTAARGDLSLIGVILAGALGSVLGALPLYALGRLLGEDRLADLADRYGKWLTVRGKDIRQADDWFDEHGPKIVLFGRLIPTVRSLLSIPAGISEMHLGTFLMYTSVGTALWSTLLATAGYQLGENYATVERFIAPISRIVVGVLVVAIVTWIVLRRRRERQRGAKSS